MSLASYVRTGQSGNDAPVINDLVRPITLATDLGNPSHPQRRAASLDRRKGEPITAVGA